MGSLLLFDRKVHNRSGRMNREMRVGSVLHKNLDMLSVCKKQGKFVVSFVVAWTLLAQFIPTGFREDNLIYAIGEIHAYDNSLFQNNVYLGGGGNITQSYH